MPQVILRRLKPKLKSFPMWWFNSTLAAWFQNPSMLLYRFYLNFLHRSSVQQLWTNLLLFLPRMYVLSAVRNPYYIALHVSPYTLVYLHVTWPALYHVTSPCDLTTWPSVCSRVPWKELFFLACTDRIIVRVYIARVGVSEYNIFSHHLYPTT